MPQYVKIIILIAMLGIVGVFFLFFLLITIKKHKIRNMYLAIDQLLNQIVKENENFDLAKSTEPEYDYKLKTNNNVKQCCSMEGLYEKLKEANMNLENVEKAKQEGFSYIIGFKNINEEYKSEKLFPFFSSRIPPKNRHNLQSILRDLNLEEYNETQLLKITKGKLFTDRYEVR